MPWKRASLKTSRRPFALVSAEISLEPIEAMVSRAQDLTMLKQVKPGDKIKFDADKINSQFTVTKIEKAKKK
jgi:ASC-1-like (ASCH) protein